MSPNGTRIPPAVSIADTAGIVWAIGNGQFVYRNGVRTNGKATQLLWWTAFIYAKSPRDGVWWKWLGNGLWQKFTLADPATVAPPPPPPPPPPSIATVTLDATSFVAGAPIRVHLKGNNGTHQNWLTFAPVGSASTVYGQWIYVPDGQTDFEWTVDHLAAPLVAPPAGGNYEARLLYANAYTVLATSAPFAVTVPYMPPVFSFPEPLSLTVGVPVSLAPFVTSVLPLVFTTFDTAQASLTANGQFTQKVAGTVSNLIAVNDGH